MAGNLDDLELDLDVGLDESLHNLREVAKYLDGAKDQTADLSGQFNKLNQATLQLAKSGALPEANATALMVGLSSIGRAVQEITGQFDRMSTRLDTAVAASSADIGEHWLYINRGVRSSTDDMRRFAEQAQAAAAATQTIVIDTSTNKMQAPQQKAPSFDMVRLASAALALRAINGVSTAMTSAKTVIADIGRTTTTTISTLDRFRIGLAAPKVNPALNTLPGIIQNITGKVAGSVEGLRGFGDATISGMPAIMASIASGLGKVMGSGDSLQATVSKLTAEFDLKRQALDRVAKIYPTTGTAVDLLKKAMDFVAPAAEKVAQQVDKANDSVRAATIGARNLAYIATGSFAKTGTSADLYARGAYHALLPTRLMAFEAKFATGSLTLMRRAFLTVTHPVHAVSMAFQKSAGEFRELRANLPPLTGNLKIAIAAVRSTEVAHISLANKTRFLLKEMQLGTRAFRAFAHGTYFASTALRGVATAAKPLTFVAGQIWKLVRPAKAAQVGIDGVTIAGHKAGIALRVVSGAASGTAAAMAKVASAGTARATGFMSSLPGMAKVGATALAGLSIALVGMGVNTAMATEKNQAVFGTMVHSMEQGKAIVASIQATKAAGLFDNQELLDSGRLLFKGGVAAVDLAGKTDQLAKIAVGTSSELNDLARIYQQGANSGSFGQDKINQLAERGIAIYEGLTHATGKSGSELKAMISDGKIGIAEMDSAMEYLTTGTGYYANSLTDVGNTSSGMLTQIKTNLMQTFGSIAGVGVTAFNPVLAGVLAMSEGIKNSVSTIAPFVGLVFKTAMSIVSGVFNFISNAAAKTFQFIFGFANVSFSGIVQGAASLMGAVGFVFNNLGTVAEYAFKRMQLASVIAFNVVGHFFGVQVPAYLSWFGKNWQALWLAEIDFVLTVFVNLGQNIRNAMTAIWDFIASGGTSSFELAWIPLTEGFRSAISSLPDIAAREMSDLELSLTADTEKLASEIGDGMGAAMATAQEALTLAAPEMPAIDPTLKAGGMGDGTDGTTTGNKKQRTDFSVSGLEKGSEAALKAIFASQKDKTPTQQLSEAKKQTALLAKMANKPEPAVLGGV